MFCPNCGVENLAQQAFCSRCGHSLTSLRLVSDGSLVDISDKLKTSEKMLNIGNGILGIFVLSGLLIIFIGLITALATGVFLLRTEYIFTILSMLSVGAVLGVPFTLFGRMKLRGALKEMEESYNVADRLTGEKAYKPRENISAGDTSNFVMPIPNSTTEETTINLKTTRH